MAYPKGSAWIRAWKDSETFRKESSVWFWGVEVLVGLLAGASGGWAGFNLLPSEATRAQEFWYPASGGIVGVFLGLCGVFALILCWNFLRAPYKQRDEAIQRVEHLESELEKPKLFDVVCPTTSLGLPINRLGDGSYRASVVAVGFHSILIAHRGELTNVTRVTASPEVRFTRADNQGWETTNSIQVTQGHNPLAGPHAMGFTWDISNPRQWVLNGLPLAMAKDELLQLPMMMVSVADGDEAGAHFEKMETCTLIIRLAVRTDKGTPPLPDQVIKLTRSDIKDSLASLGIQPETEEGLAKQ